MTDNSIVPLESVVNKIYIFRNKNVMIDSDLAHLYGVATKRLNEQVKRNIERFPPDFMFQLNETELNSLRSQNATTKQRGGRRYLPYVFTEHGAVMLATVLNSEMAIKMSVFVVRAFVELREIISTNRRLSERIEQIENIAQQQGVNIESLIEAVNQLILQHQSNHTKFKEIKGFRNT